jgi:histidine triad (HIT) family protein
MDCIFCRIIAGEIPSTKVYEDDTVLAFHDINPVAEKHYLIIPKEHIASTLDLTEKNASIVSDLYLAANTIAKEQGIAGFKLNMNVGHDGGQIVMHIHLHLIAGKWSGEARGV